MAFSGAIYPNIRELTISSAVVNGSGTSGLIKNGRGILDLSGAATGNTFSGPTTVNAGTLYFLNAARGAANSNISVNTGATLAAQLAVQNATSRIGKKLTLNGEVKYWHIR